MKHVGITGGLGSGKSTVAKMFARHGAKILDADQVVHELLKSDPTTINHIQHCFGQEVIEDGQIVRQRLAAIVFTQQEKLKELEQIIHPRVREQFNQAVMQWKRSGFDGVVVYDVPLLIEKGMHSQMDKVIVVTVDEETQIKRASQRLNIPVQEAKRRISAQMPLKDKIRYADFTIDNTGPLTETEKQVDNIWQKL